jgi:hypothetical protein
VVPSQSAAFPKRKGRPPFANRPPLHFLAGHRPGAVHPFAPRALASRRAGFKAQRSRSSRGHARLHSKGAAQSFALGGRPPSCCGSSAGPPGGRPEPGRSSLPLIPRAKSTLFLEPFDVQSGAPRLVRFGFAVELEGRDGVGNELRVAGKEPALAVVTGRGPIGGREAHRARTTEWPERHPSRSPCRCWRRQRATRSPTPSGSGTLRARARVWTWPDDTPSSPSLPFPEAAQSPRMKHLPIDEARLSRASGIARSSSSSRRTSPGRSRGGPFVKMWV